MTEKEPPIIYSHHEDCQCSCTELISVHILIHTIHRYSIDISGQTYTGADIEEKGGKKRVFIHMYRINTVHKHIAFILIIQKSSNHLLS